jgi:hypothetical protein
MKKIEKKREEFVIKIGPLLKKVLEDQKTSVDEVTYSCMKTSFYEAGEIVAKKMMGLV